jgi:hypothetical protein
MLAQQRPQLGLALGLDGAATPRPTPDGSPSSATSASLLGTPVDYSPPRFGRLGLKPDYALPSAGFDTQMHEYQYQPGVGLTDRGDGGYSLPFDVAHERILGTGVSLGGLGREAPQGTASAAFFRSTPQMSQATFDQAAQMQTAYSAVRSEHTFPLLEPYGEQPSPMQMGRPLPPVLPARPTAAQAHVLYQAATPAMQDRSLSSSLWNVRAPEPAPMLPMANTQMPLAPPEWLRGDEQRLERAMGFPDLHSRSASLQNLQGMQRAASTAFSAHAHAHTHSNSVSAHGHGNPSDVNFFRRTQVAKADIAPTADQLPLATSPLVGAAVPPLRSAHHPCERPAGVHLPPAEAQGRRPRGPREDH